jgi:hypothetical protein
VLVGEADLEGSDFTVPNPPAIPPRERRRSPLPVKLGVEVAQQACDMAGVDASTVASVFTSAMGDTGITDYMCRQLAGPQKMLSPTKFHNSVHNAPSGYWSIATKNHAASGFIGGFEHSFPVALLEATVLCVTEDCPVVLVANDVAHRAPFEDIVRIEQSFACAVLLNPAPGTRGWSMALENCPGSVTWPLPGHPALAEMSESNPAARSLALLEALALARPAALQLPLNKHGHLHLAIDIATRA